MTVSSEPSEQQPLCTCEGHEHEDGKHGCGIEIVPGRAWCPCTANPTERNHP